VLAVLLTVGACCAAPGLARTRAQVRRGPYTTLSVGFRPLRLGAPTTISFAVRISRGLRKTPLPVTRVEVSYPSDLGLLTSQLGLESCDPAALVREGWRVCPPDSKMGQGRALIEVPFGPETIRERVKLRIYAAPSSDGYVHLAILAEGKEPVLARIVLAGVLLPGRMRITIPPIITVPGTPYASLISLKASLGGALTYYERIHGHTVAYHPPGIGLPDSCPHGGWQLIGNFTFVGGSKSRARSVIRCPGAHAANTGRAVTAKART
jgi:hypothetical protein